MARLPLPDPAEMGAEQKAQYDRFPSNLTRAPVLAGPRLSQALPNLANALRAAPLEAKFREAVILRVAAIEVSAYERMQHLEQARKAGWSDDEIAGIESGRPPASVVGLLAFVDDVVRTGDASDDSFSKVSGMLQPRDVATVLLLVGHYMMIARFTRVLRVELDPHADSWSHEH